MKDKWFYIFLFLFSLTPIVWFLGRADVIINGVDTNFPLNPSDWFLRRLFTWNSLANGGADFSSSTAGLFFHLIQVIPYLLRFNLQTTEVISFIFWFGLIVFAAYCFVRYVISNKRIIQLLFICFYVFNLYLFNTWENVKVGNLALYSGLPLGLTILFRLQKKEISFKKGLLFISLTGLILSGSGINPAYFACFILAVLLYFVANNLFKFKKDKLIFLFKNTAVFLAVIMGINFFWILPTGNFIFSNITPDSSIENIGFTNWIDSLSANNSFLNILRIQGAWDWYSIDGVTLEPLYIPYSRFYFNFLPFLIFSFLIPFIALLSLIFRDKSKDNLYLMFGSMLLISVFLGAGTHEPSGSLFRFLSNHLPFFSLFRSPWYIFTPLLTLSIAGLVCLFFNYLLFLSDYLKNFRQFIDLSKYRRVYKFFIYLICIILIFSNLIYSYPLIKGSIFRPNRYDSFYVKFPSYIFESAEWLNKNNNGRVIVYPDDELENYSWGYRGIESLLNLLVNTETLYRPLNDNQSSVVKLIDDYYEYLVKGENEAANSIANKLNISKVLEKKDQNSLAIDLATKLNSYKAVQFENWKFYLISEGKNTDKIYTSSNYSVASPQENAFEGIALLSQNEILLNPNDSIINRNIDLKNPSKKILLAKNLQQTESKNFFKPYFGLSERLRFRDLSTASFEIYINERGEYRPILDRYKLEDFGISVEDSLSLLIDGEIFNLTIDSQNDSFVFFNKIELEKGLHVLSFSIKNENLIDNYLNLSLTSTEGDGLISKTVEDGKEIINIFNQKENETALVYQIKDFDPLQTYLIQLGYKHIYGNKAVVFVTQRTDKGLVKVQPETLPNHPEWKEYSFYFQPIKTESILEIRLAAPQTPDPLGTTVNYSDLSIQKVFNNNLFLVSDSSQKISENKVEFTKKTPIEYSGKMKNLSGSQVLVFSENFSKFWNLEVWNSKREKVEKDFPHFTVNSYANGWFVDLTGEYTFKISYKNQTLYILGGLISLTIFTVSLILFILNRKK